MGVSATRSGRFSLRIQTEEVSVQTNWTGCEAPKVTCTVTPHNVQLIPNVISTADSDQEGEEVDPDEWYHAIVSVKSFLQFLSCYVVSTTTIACRSCIFKQVAGAHLRGNRHMS